jgi:uncharacterized membrane protein
VAATLTAHHDRHKLVRLGIAAVLGAAVSLVLPVPPDAALAAHVLIGFTVAALAFALPLIRVILRATPEETEKYVRGLDPGRSVVDIVVLVAALASLGGVATMLLTKPTAPEAKLAEAVITIATVFSGWLLVHTMFALRYARHWFNAETDCIDYHMKQPPSYSDFLYTAFAVGVSFAISDTDLKTTRIRRIALGQAWLSYLFGTVVVAAMINALVNLAG